MLLPSVPHIAERCLISLTINQVGEEWQRGGAEGSKKRSNGAALKPCLIAQLLETGFATPKIWTFLQG